MANPAYMCDFETTTNPNDCRVWAACAVSMDDGQTAHLSTSIDAFMEWCQKGKSKKLFFHNLKFDGEFILSWLLRNHFEHVGMEQKAVPAECFQTLIDDMGQFYKMTICFSRRGKKVQKVDIYDSLKRIPDSAEKIAKDYGLPMAKGSIDYTMTRPVDYQPTEDEKDYIQTDCRIVQMALQFQEQEGMRKMTTASNALAWYKDLVDNRFYYWFPVLPKALDDDIRKSYKGGFTWANPRFQGKDVGAGIVLDVNSLYPWAMYDTLLPWGYPVYFEGKPQPDDLYPLYIVRIRCAFRLKKGFIPSIQIKGKIFRETEYLTSSEIRIGGYNELMRVDLTLTSVDFELFMKHYDVFDLEYISGYKFKGQRGMFKEYIDHWMHVKATSPKGSAQRALAKLMLNSLYGKFASSTERYNKVPVMCPDGVVRYYCHNEPARDSKGRILFDGNQIRWATDDEGSIIHIPPTIADPVYTPVAAFITAYAREKTISSAQAVFPRFMYADTDSLHLLGTEIPEGMEIHPTNLGAWDHEKTFTRARFLRAKTYIEEVDGKLEVTCAGMPDKVKYYDPEDPEDRPEDHPTWDNFRPGKTYPGKMLPKRVPGGIVLDPVVFSIQL